MTTQEVYQPHKNGPRFFYGYIVVALCFLIMMVSFGLMDSFGVFVKPFLNEFGWANGGDAASDTPLVARLFGLSSVGAILGAASCAFCIGAALGPVITGHIFDSTASYQLAFLVCIALCIIAIILASSLKLGTDTSRKILTNYLPGTKI